MKKSLADRLRKLSALIESDPTPTEEEIHTRRKSLTRKIPGDKGSVRAEEVSIKKTAPPKMKPSRKMKDTKKKWKVEDEVARKEKRRDYQQEYRQTGKVNETDSPNSQ